MGNFAIRAAETWTGGTIAGGLLLCVVTVALIVWAVLVTLRR